MFNFKKIKFNKGPARNAKHNFAGGFTYVELIVVLSIGAILSSVSLFNYKLFQDKVDLKNVANDLGLKIVEMQKSAIAGKIPAGLFPPSEWRPSYGLYFQDVVPAAKTKNFYIFADLISGDTQDKRLSSTSPCPADECLSMITLTKGNYLKEINVKYQGGSITPEPELNITFTRPNVGASFWTNSNELTNVEYVEIVLSNRAEDVFSSVFIYPSGRIEVK